MPDLVETSQACGFGGIELWEPHWSTGKPQIRRWRADHPEVELVALSAYLDLTRASVDDWRTLLDEKLRDCRSLGIPMLRLFTGDLAGADADAAAWTRFFERLNAVQGFAETYGVDVVFETHPHTLLDGADGVERFLDRISSRKLDRIGLNFDAFHIWEFGADVVECLRSWSPHVKHVHLKNAKRKTAAFAPGNVFSPRGDFDDLTSLRCGVIDVPAIVRELSARSYRGAATVEWFGFPDRGFLGSEVAFLKACASFEGACATARAPASERGDVRGDGYGFVPLRLSG